MIDSILSVIERQTLQHPVRTLLLLPIVLLFSYLIANEYVRRAAKIPKFPGPPGLPVIGNLAAIRVNAAEQYRKWAKSYGPVYQIQLGNVPVIVVNSAAAARTIFGQNSQALSSRPVFYTFHKVCIRKYQHSPFYTGVLS